MFACCYPYKYFFAWCVPLICIAARNFQCWRSSPLANGRQLRRHFRQWLYYPCVNLDDVEIIIKAVCLYATLLLVKAELDQLAEGLELFGILKLVWERPLSIRPLFVHDQDVDLTAEWVLELFSDIQYSKTGPTKQLSEETTCLFWHGFINDLANGLIDKHMHMSIYAYVYVYILRYCLWSVYTMSVTNIHSLDGEEMATTHRLEDLLIFVTEADHIPLLGLPICQRYSSFTNFLEEYLSRFPWLALVRRPSACQPHLI